MTRQKKLQLSGIITAPLCKGSSAAGGEGLFLQPSNRCAVSEPLSARPASVLRTLANPFHHFVVPLPLHREAHSNHSRRRLLINRAAGAPFLFSLISKKSRSRGIFCSFLYIFFPEFIFFIAEAAADLDLVRIGEEVGCIFFGKAAKRG